MKVETRSTTTNIEYPCLMRSTLGIIILAQCEVEDEHLSGIVLDGALTSRTIGECSDQWAKHDFKPFTGSVTLTN